MALDELEVGLERKARQGDERGARAQRGPERDDEPHDMGEGRDGDDGVARPELERGAAWATATATFAWVSITPFGSPVVPLE